MAQGEAHSANALGACLSRGAGISGQGGMTGAALHGRLAPRRITMRRVLAVALLAICSSASAQQYPSKPIRFIVGFPPGGSADPTARIVGAALADQLGQPVIVENRPGADSAIGAQYVAQQAPDGYTLFFGSNSAMTAAVALKKAPLYDPLKDFTPIGLVGRATFFFDVNPEVPAKSMQEFIAYARANPGKLNYG